MTVCKGWEGVQSASENCLFVLHRHGWCTLRKKQNARFFKNYCLSLHQSWPSLFFFFEIPPYCSLIRFSLAKILFQLESVTYIPKKSFTQHDFMLRKEDCTSKEI